MKLWRTRRFKKSYEELNKEEQKRADKALSLLTQNLTHPGLHVKKIKGTDYYEARVSDDIRISFQIEFDLIILRVVGRHDDVLKKP